jgi:hypothetical protein
MVSLVFLIVSCRNSNILTATIQHLPLTNCETALSGLHTRYTNISKMGDKLPADDIVETPEGLDLDVIINGLPDEWFKAKDSITPTNGEPELTNGDHQTSTDGAQPSQSTSRSVSRAALALALLGWDTASDGAAGLVGCGACFRRLGLWMYKPKDNGDVTVYTSLNVADEHMDYCPWIDKSAQSGTGRSNEKAADLRAGWQLVAEAVKVKNRRRLRAMASTDTLHANPGTPVETADEEENPDAKKKADREWWAKIRRVRQVLTAKSPKRKPVLPDVAK